MLEKQFNSD